MQIQQKTFIVTGGASGLGAATVRHFHALGANLLIADMDSSKGEKLVAELGQRVIFCKTDVTNEGEAQAAIEIARGAFGSIQGLINCAGIAPAKKILGKTGPHDLASFIRTVQINLIGTFNMTRLVACAMSQNVVNPEGERGVIINTASIAAEEGQIGQAAYAAAKGGVISMTLPIARELANYGIRIMTIAPGLFATPMLENMRPDVQDALNGMTVFPRRLGLPAEYAQLAQHIIENVMLNGTTIRLDGSVRLK
jgi:NAD(P)-dependent dehydrogenase (short-subunit alcohol dehydrogenase family)